MNKKTAILSLLLLLISALSVSAQDKDDKTEKLSDKIAANIIDEIDFGVGLKQHGVTPLFAGINLGYHIIPRLHVYARYEGMIGLSNVGDNRAYDKTWNLGGGIGYTFYYMKYKGETTTKWSVRAQVTNSIGSVDWKNTSYSIGVYSQCKSTKFARSPLFGIGFKHINSHTEGIRDYNSLFVCMGLGF